MCKNLLTVYLKSIMKALVLLAIGMFALPNDARAQCGDVPNTQYNTFEINFSLSMAEFPLIPDCAAGNIASCQEAFTQLYEADVAINQMSIQCVDTYNNCRRTSLANLIALSEDLVGQAIALQTIIGGFNSFGNTTDMLRQWEQIRLCNSPPQPSCTPPSNISNPVFRKNYYFPAKPPYPDGYRCLTAAEAQGLIGGGEGISLAEGYCAPICPAGYQPQYYNGVEVCLVCPAGTSYQDNCCK